MDTTDVPWRCRPENQERIRAAKRKYYEKNKEQVKARAKEHAKRRVEEDPLYWQKIQRKSRYGLSHEDIEDMLDSQGHACALCRKELSGKFTVDHCHDTGKVRGLLCYTCNTGLGKFGDDPERLRDAINYLYENG
jgi:hypothetical protein